MKKIRVFTGLLITLHGLLRIIYINKYIDFVHQNYAQLIPGDSLLTIGSALLPFLEFFVGLLILFGVANRISLRAGLFVSLLMSAFILAGSLYPRLIYHAVIVGLIVSMCIYQNRIRKNRIIL